MKATCPECGYEFEHDSIMEEANNPKSPSRIKTESYMKTCYEKMQRENPCPKRGSHNVDIDLGTPMWCNDCGHEWED